MLLHTLHFLSHYISLLKSFCSCHDCSPLLRLCKNAVVVLACLAQVTLKAENLFLPDDHPVKKSLDALFKKCSFRIIHSENELFKAGFIPFGEPHTTGVYVLEHPKIKGFLIKCYLDTQDQDEYTRFSLRIEGSRLADAIIKRRGQEHLFTVPQKWLYTIPEKSAPPLVAKPKRYLLVVERMKILNREKNRIKWKSSKVTKKLIHHFYDIITEGGFADQVIVDNATFCTDERIAFLDTEIFHHFPINYNRFTHYLSPSMRKEWLLLIDK